MKSRWYRLIPALALPGLLFFLSTARIRDPDIWLYLKSGEYFLQRGEILKLDVFSYTRLGHPWQNHSWLSQAILAGLFRTSGLAGLYLARYLLLGGAFWLVYRASRLNAGRPAAALLTLAAILAAAGRFVVRPELFTFLFLPLLILILERERQGKRPRLFLLPPLFLAWSNLHGGFILGLVILGAYCLGEGLTSLIRVPGWRGTRLPPPELRRLLLWAGAALVASLVNPYGPGSLLYSAHIAPLRPFIYAWQPLSWSEWPRWPLYQYVLAALLLMAAAGLTGGWRRIDLPRLLVLTLFGLAAVRGSRNVAPFVLAGSPLLAALLPVRFRYPRSRLAGRIVGAAILAIFLAVAATEFRETDPGRADIHKVFGFGVSPFSYPLETAGIIESEEIEGRFFNSFGIGNYLTWRLWPEKRNYVDGRLSVFGTDFLLGYNNLLNHPELFPEEARRWDFRGAVVDHPNPSNLALLRWLEESPEWTLIFYDSNSALYLHRDHPDRERLAGRLPEPGPEAARLSSREAFARGRFLLQAGRAGDSIPYLLRAEGRYPEARVVTGLLARAYLESGDYPEGKIYLDRAERAGADWDWLDLARGRLNLVAGEYNQARRAAERALARDPGSAEAHFILGEVLLAAGEYAKAEEFFLRAAESGLASRTALRLGDLRFRAGDFPAAIGWYEQVGPSDPGYPRSRVYLAGSYVQTGEIERGRETFTSCGEEFPEFYQICQFNLAVIARRLGDTEAARNHLREVTDPALIERIASDPDLRDL